MSIFGKLDAAAIPTNAYFIEQGEYEAEVTAADIRTNKDDVRQLVIEYTITSPESAYCGMSAKQYLTLVDEDMDADKLALLSPSDQQTIKRNAATVKKVLCGNSIHDGLGVDVDILNGSDWKPIHLLGTPVSLAISNWGKDGVNVKWANIRPDFPK